MNTREKKNESKMMKARLSTENIDITKKVRPREIVIKGDGRALKIKIKTINQREHNGVLVNEPEIQNSSPKWVGGRNLIFLLH